MKTLIRVIAALVAACVIAALAFKAWRNPESGPLTAADRTGVAGKFVSLPAGVTHYELSAPVGKSDTGRVVVLVHGFSVPYYIWDSSVVALTKAGRRVLRYDLYGRGFSDRPDVAYDGALFDGQLDALLDSLRIAQPIDLVGLSFGGFVVAHYTSTHPKRVHTLTMMDPSSSQPRVPGFLKLPVIGPWFFQTMAVPGMADGQSSDFLHPEHFPGWADKYRPQMHYDGFGRALLRTRIMMSQTDYSALFSDVGKTGVPTLLVWGRQDPTVPFTNSDSVKRGIPSLTFVPVDSSGHLPGMEQSRVTHAAMLAFFAQHP